MKIDLLQDIFIVELSKIIDFMCLEELKLILFIIMISFTMTLISGNGLKLKYLQTQKVHSLVLVIDKQQLYIYGGFGEKGGYTFWNDIFAIHLEKTNTGWKKIEYLNGELSPPSARPLTGELIDGKFLVFGGYDSKVPTAKLVSFDTQTSSWNNHPMWFVLGDNVSVTSSKFSEPIARYGHSINKLTDKFLIYGGSGSMFLSEVMVLENQS
eukprot:TRINITY_DN2559_c0_g1_i1.p1 TRINITY_DN2559_c0_g1~~TRINITY_DN2559_c0_g1_i1.p1  ORF type:complete len:211 (+),score=54.46 TRINITY_DN2559_c0_g1_i1:318-950(+)